MDINEDCKEILKTSTEAAKLSKTYSSAELFEICELLKNTLAILVCKVTNDSKFDEILTIAIVHFNIGQMLMEKNDADNLLTAAEYFRLSLDLLHQNELNRKAILIILTAYDALNIIWQKLGNTEHSVADLNKALELYMEYTKMGDNYPEPIDVIGSIIEDEERSKISPLNILHQLHVTNVEHLLKIYVLDDKSMHTFVIYMHNLLKIEMIYRETFLPEEYVDWVLVAFHLSYYFIYHTRFAEAKNHITTAFYMLEKFRNSECSGGTMVQRYFDRLIISGKRAWVNYGLDLLRLSHEKFRQNKLGSKEPTNEPSETVAKTEVQQGTLVFSGLKKDPERVIIHITDKYVTKYSEVNTIFINLKKWLEEIQKYFEKNNDLANQAITVLALSKAYKYLGLFEQNKDKLNKIYKTRVEILDCMNNKLDKKSLATKPLYQRICLELGVVNALRISMFDEEIRITNKVILKDFEDDVKEIACASMNHYTAYIKSLATDIE
jgi:tetratricopeptide (TPR) repeat protein